MKFVIKTPKGLVAGYSASNFCVQVAGTADWAKFFSTRQAAEKFIAKYSGGRYGLNAQTAEIIAI